ncbi:uncharacterized protein J3D65DRAFT_97245 [Phyllosticta citribraziliensis]|uniref:Uncharacterized protein n=1 Tax=Phyllosticta citribraziliensis TaxID=989973 RepID=A0ABR1LC67_9PEZI
MKREPDSRPAKAKRSVVRRWLAPPRRHTGRTAGARRLSQVSLLLKLNLDELMIRACPTARRAPVAIEPRSSLRSPSKSFSFFLSFFFFSFPLCQFLLFFVFSIQPPAERTFEAAGRSAVVWAGFWDRRRLASTVVAASRILPAGLDHYLMTDRDDAWKHPSIDMHGTTGAAGMRYSYPVSIHSSASTRTWAAPRARVVVGRRATPASYIHVATTSKNPRFECLAILISGRSTSSPVRVHKSVRPPPPPPPPPPLPLPTPLSSGTFDPTPLPYPQDCPLAKAFDPPCQPQGPSGNPPKKGHD